MSVVRVTSFQQNVHKCIHATLPTLTAPFYVNFSLQAIVIAMNWVPIRRSVTPRTSSVHVSRVSVAKNAIVASPASGTSVEYRMETLDADVSLSSDTSSNKTKNYKPA